MRFLFSIAVFFFGLNTIVAQDVVKMEKENGVYKIPCKINGLPLKFIFDTGASNVSISLTEALFMLKNGYLKESDIRGTIYYSIANGEIAEGTKINLQKIEVGKQILYNVEASIVHTSQAPLLFGQSAMERFGKFTMDYTNANLLIGNASNTTSNTTSAAAIKSVKIGTQTWSTKNLDVSTFLNGDKIPEARTAKDIYNAEINKTPIWSYYNFDMKNGEKYGKLYNWYAVIDARGLIPTSWRVPNDEDWGKLFSFLGGKEVWKIENNMDIIEGGNVAKKLKSLSGWKNNGNGINSVNFNALPGGKCSRDGEFYGIETSGYWWCSEEYCNVPRINTDSSYIGLMFQKGKEDLFSIRLIK